jgi:hypothetical protein
MKKGKAETTHKLMGILWVCLCMVFAVNPVGAVEDITPPYLVSPVPEPGSTGVPQCVTVKVGIGDDISGVAIGSISVTINGSPPDVEPIIEPFYSENGYNVYCRLEEMEPGTVVTIGVKAMDQSPNQNELVDEWQFMLSEMRFDSKLVPIFPSENSWLDFDREHEKARFNWTQGYHSEGYRMLLRLSGGESGTVDFQKGDYQNSMGIVTVEFDVFQSDWGLMSSVGEIEWQIAPIDTSGLILDQYTPSRSIRYATGHMPMPVTPEHGGLLNSITPPYFTWETLGDAQHYYLVLIRKNLQGQFTDEVRINYIPSFCREMEVDPGHWDTYGAGTWVWTIVGVLPGGIYSDYFLYEFDKTVE